MMAFERFFNLSVRRVRDKRQWCLMRRHRNRTSSNWRKSVARICILATLAICSLGSLAGAEEKSSAAQENNNAIGAATELGQELGRMFSGNDLWSFGYLGLAILCGLLAGRITRSILQFMASRAKKKNRLLFSVTLEALTRAVTFPLLLIGIRVGITMLTLSEPVQQLLGTLLAVLFSLAIAWVVYVLIDVVEHLLHRFADKTPSKLDDMLVPMVRASLRVTVVVLAIVQIATIISDKPVTSVIAGLGVGGIAIGLAAQDMIKNFFGSMMIFSDRPFELGDRVVIDGYDGPVESVGFRSTQIRTLDGHIVTIPNGELANKSIQNVSKRPYIKRNFQIGVTYDTSKNRVQEAIDILKSILDNHQGMDSERPARVYFTEFQDSALVIDVTYWFTPADYYEFCEFNEQVNLKVLAEFNEAGIEFAFPTQTLHVVSESPDSSDHTNAA